MQVERATPSEDIAQGVGRHAERVVSVGDIHHRSTAVDEIAAELRQPRADVRCRQSDEPLVRSKSQNQSSLAIGRVLDSMRVRYGSHRHRFRTTQIFNRPRLQIATIPWLRRMRLVRIPRYLFRPPRIEWRRFRRSLSRSGYRADRVPLCLHAPVVRPGTFLGLFDSQPGQDIGTHCSTRAN